MEQELYHHGVKGMKWGVRRYQNKDGSRTALGRKRAERKQLRSDRKAYDKERKTNWKDAKKQGRGFSQDARDFRKSDAYKDAKQSNKQLKRENLYLTKRERDKLYRDVKNGDDYTKSYMKARGRTIAKIAAKETAKSTAKKVIGGAILAAGMTYVQSRTNTQMKLPAGNIIDVTDYKVIDL